MSSLMYGSIISYPSFGFCMRRGTKGGRREELGVKQRKLSGSVADTPSVLTHEWSEWAGSISDTLVPRDFNCICVSEWRGV